MRLSFFLALLFALLCSARAEAQQLVVWHAYRGEEAAALEQSLAQIERETPGLSLTILAVPFDAYASKLESAIPHGHGPDLFIDAHERIASYVARALVTPLERTADDIDVAREAVSYEGRQWAVPLAIKCLALYVDERRWQALGSPPLETLEAIEALRPRIERDAYPLVYYASNAYFHAPLLHAYGASMIDPSSGAYRFVGEATERSIDRVRDLTARQIILAEADGSSAAQYLSSGRALSVISGPWLAAELPRTLRYRVFPLPSLASTGRAMAPFATIEGAFVSAYSPQRALATRVALALAAPASTQLRALRGRQIVARRDAFDSGPIAQDPLLSVFHRAAEHAVPMPAHPNMRSAFEPANMALRRALRGDISTRLALEQGQRRFGDATRPLPSARSPVLAQLLLGVFALFALFRIVQRSRDAAFRREVARSMTAYAYVTHAVVVVGLLVVLPLVLGALTSLYAGRNGNLYYVGGANYAQILTLNGALTSGSFYLVLLVTVLWTVANLVLHLSLGVALAMLLSRPLLKLKAMYRVLLIVPWAVPSYVTALAWKGMFHRQTGAINALLRAVGVEPVSWFAQFSTAFSANVLTNTWLGFPFMMVVTMAALAGIPKDLYEAAEVDGASAWQRFKHVTVPLLRPTLAPAAAMGAVWTFNQFNVIFLVSGGEPDGRTEILVTEAYRWAFTRQAQYGYAAAYAVLIFGVLVLLTRALDRLTRTASGAAAR